MKPDGVHRLRLPIALLPLLAAAACRSVPPDAMSPDADRRRVAAEHLAGRSDAESLARLRTLLADTHLSGRGVASAPVVRSAAARALGLSRNPGAVPDLSRALESDASVQVRADAAVALGDLRALTGAVPLRKALAGDDAPEVRRSAAHALGRLKDRASVPDLIRALSDTDRSVVLRAHGALVALTGEDRSLDSSAWEAPGGAPP